MRREPSEQELRAMKSMAREAERIHNPYVRALAGAVEEAIEVFELSDPDGDHLDIEAPEDAAVAQLCVRYGYGAVISSAVRQWRRRDPVGAFTRGACVGTVQSTIRKLRAALEG